MLFVSSRYLYWSSMLRLMFSWDSCGNFMGIYCTQCQFLGLICIKCLSHSFRNLIMLTSHVILGPMPNICTRDPFGHETLLNQQSRAAWSKTLVEFVRWLCNFVLQLLGVSIINTGWNNGFQNITTSAYLFFIKNLRLCRATNIGSGASLQRRRLPLPVGFHRYP